MLTKLFLFLICIAIIARFIGLDYIPPHLSNDEIGAAYDAYSISKTLRDGHNQFLPITFLSHGIYRSALAVYLTIPSIMILGNSDFSARLPSAILGSLTIILLGLLVLELTQNSRLALISSLLLAFSPWHFSASRWTMESNYALFFIVLGVYLFFYGLKHRNYWATLASFTTFAFSIYAYYTEWGLTPLIICSLLFLYRKVTLKRKIYYIAVFLFVLLLLPLTVDFLDHVGSSRASTEFISKETPVTVKSKLNTFQEGQVLLKAILDKYSRYTSLGYIFFYGSNFLPKANPYQVGFFLSPLLISFILGLLKLKKFFKEHTKFIYFWLFASPLIPAFTQGDISNVRSLPIVIPVAIVTAAGSLYMLDYINKKIFLKILATGLISISFLYFLFIYIFHFPVQNAEGFQYGFKQMALYIKKHYTEYEKIIVDYRFGNKEFYFYGVPSSYIPFYTYLDPRKVQKAQTIPQGSAFDKYEFRFIDWDKEKIQKNYLYAVPYDNVPDLSKALKLVYEIQLPNHKVEFKLYSLSE